jgi:Fic family protein
MNTIARINKLPTTTYLMIAKIDGLKGQWVGGGTLSPQILNRLLKTALATSTGSSTRIEGSSLTDEQIEDVMKGLSTSKFKDRDVQEVKGYYETLRLVFDNYENIELSENNILMLHSNLLKYSSKDLRHKGAYKHQENRVEMHDAEGALLEVVFDPTPAYLTPKEMQELVEETRILLQSEDQHPLLVISNFVVTFLKIHPFLDGNGRMSRLLTCLLLLNCGYSYVPYVSHEKIIEDSKIDYYIALRRSQKSFGTDSESIDDWTVYFLKVLLAQAEQAIKLTTLDSISLHFSALQAKVWDYLQSVESAAPREIVEATGITAITVAKTLLKFKKLRLISMIGEGRSTRYRKL